MNSEFSILNTQRYDQLESYRMNYFVGFRRSTVRWFHVFDLFHPFVKATIENGQTIDPICLDKRPSFKIEPIRVTDFQHPPSTTGCIETHRWTIVEHNVIVIRDAQTRKIRFETFDVGQTTRNQLRRFRTFQLIEVPGLWKMTTKAQVWLSIHMRRRGSHSLLKLLFKLLYLKISKNAM